MGQAIPMGSDADTMPKMGLEEAVRRAISQNPAQIVALQETLRLSALKVTARAGALPNLGLNVSYTRLDHDRKINGLVVQNKDQLAGSIALNVPIVSPLTWAQTRRASYFVEVSKLDAVEIRRQIALSTAHAYLDVMVQRREIEVQRRALENAKAHYLYTHTRFIGGIGNALDDARAGQEVASSEVTIEQGLAQLRAMQEALGVLVGVEGPLDTEKDVTLPRMPDVDPRATPDRGDVLRDRRRVAAAKYVRRSTWSEYAPGLNGSFTPFHQNPPTPLMPRFGWILQVVLAVPLVVGGARIGLARERDARLAQSRAQLEGVVRQAKADVRAALSAITHADAALIASLRAAEFAQDSLRMATFAYQAGATTNIEVIDAERRARDAETAVVVAEDRAQRARLDLLSATGHLP